MQQHQIIEEAKFTYSLFGIAVENQVEIIKEQWETR